MACGDYCMRRFATITLFSSCLMWGLIAAESPPRIAVVDVSRVFDTYAKVAAVKAALQKIFEPQQAELKQLERKLHEWEGRLRLDLRDPKKDIGFFKELQAFTLQKFEFELKVQEFQSAAAEREKAEMKSVLDDIKSAIAAVARAEKFDIVIRAPEDDAPPVSGNDVTPRESMQEMIRRFRQSPVLTYKPDLDITAKIITTLNDDYKKGSR
jgi:Skp family chaperone for outer membrane proteins